MIYLLIFIFTTSVSIDSIFGPAKDTFRSRLHVCTKKNKYVAHQIILSISSNRQNDRPAYNSQQTYNVGRGLILNGLIVDLE